MEGIIVGIAAAVSTITVGLISFFGAKNAANKQKETKEVEARGPEWQAFLTEVRAENQKTKDELNGKIDRLNSKVQHLEDGLNRVTGKYQLSLNYIMQWRKKHPKDSLIDALPSDLREDLPAYWPRDEPG